DVNSPRRVTPTPATLRLHPAAFRSPRRVGGWGGGAGHAHRSWGVNPLPPLRGPNSLVGRTDVKHTQAGAQTPHPRASRASQAKKVLAAARRLEVSSGVSATATTATMIPGIPRRGAEHALAGLTPSGRTRIGASASEFGLCRIRVNRIAG